MSHVLVSGDSLGGFEVSSLVGGRLPYGAARAVVTRLIQLGVPVVFVGSAKESLML